MNDFVCNAFYSQVLLCGGSGAELIAFALRCNQIVETLVQEEGECLSLSDSIVLFTF